MNCSDCNTFLKLQICHSQAGYYLGFFCPYCGPYSRESEYFRSRVEAEIYLVDAQRGDEENQRLNEELDRMCKRIA